MKQWLISMLTDLRKTKYYNHPYVVKIFQYVMDFEKCYVHKTIHL